MIVLDWSRKTLLDVEECRDQEDYRVLPKQFVFALVTFLHDLFTALWIGGLLTLGLTVLPAARRLYGGPDGRGEVRKLMTAIQRRLSPVVDVSIVGLVVTGILLSNRAPVYGGFLRFGNPYSAMLSIKHILVIVMVIVALVRSLVFGRRAERPTPVRERTSVLLLYLNVGLGVLMLLLSGFTAVLASRPPA